MCYIHISIPRNSVIWRIYLFKFSPYYKTHTHKKIQQPYNNFHVSIEKNLLIKNNNIKKLKNLGNGHIFKNILRTLLNVVQNEQHKEKRFH